MLGIFSKLLYILTSSPIHTEANFWRTSGPEIGGPGFDSDSNKNHQIISSQRMTRSVRDFNTDFYRIMTQGESAGTPDTVTNTTLKTANLPAKTNSVSLPSPESIGGTGEKLTKSPLTKLGQTLANSTAETGTQSLSPFFDNYPVNPTSQAELLEQQLTGSGFLRRMFAPMFILAAVSGFLCMYLNEVFHSNKYGNEDVKLYFGRSGFLQWVSAWAFLSGQLFTSDNDRYLIVTISAVAFGSYFIGTGYLVTAVLTIIFAIFTKP